MFHRIDMVRNLMDRYEGFDPALESGFYGLSDEALLCGIHESIWRG
jgi:hypothetical protein